MGFLQIGRSKLLFSVILEALHPALPGLTTGWLADWLAVRLADELTVSVWIFKNHCSLSFRFVLSRNNLF